MNLIGNINAIPFRRFRGGGGVAPFPSIPGMIARYSALGLTNEQMTENPVWKDLTGNGHDLQMKNFAWKGMSGIGGYVVDIDEWGTNSTAAYYERNSIKITATFKENASLDLLYHNIKLRQSCVLKVTGIPEGCDAFLDDRLGNRFYMSEDGVYEIIPSNFLAEALYLSIEKYPEWTIGIDVKVSERYKCDDILWECIKDHKTQENWKPSLATASLWKVVVEDREGTENDPIPYTPPMELFNGKFYTQDGVKYKCTRDSGTPLSHDLKDLVGTYVETV